MSSEPYYSHSDFRDDPPKQKASDDYFTRPAPHRNSEDLIDVDSDNEAAELARSPDVLSLRSLLTPATLSPSLDNVETSPLLETRSNPPGYASTNYTPVVCCRAGSRPMQIPPTNTTPLFPNRPPQDIGSQPSWYQDPEQPDRRRTTPQAARRRNVFARSCESVYLRRWILSLGLIAGLLLLQLCLKHEPSADGPANGDDSGCSRAYCTESFTHTFNDIKSFSLVEELNAGSLRKQAFTGKVWLETAPEDQRADIAVSVSYGSSTQLTVDSPNWKWTDSSLYLGPPTLSKKRSLLTNFFGVRVEVIATVYLKANLSLEALSINTSSLAINASPHLFGSNLTDNGPLLQATVLKSTSSPISLPRWVSRRTIVHTTSSAISGTFTLLDFLELASQSGSLTATVEPGSADSSRPEPAQFSASTASGGVKISFPSGSGVFSIPKREYKSSVSTQSGSIHGTYLLGATTSLTSQSGSIGVDILPYDSQAESSLRTTGGSGSTEVRVLTPYQGDGEPFKGMRSSHESRGSGSVKLRYPGYWEGKISASSGSGSLKLKGRDVVVDETSRCEKHVLAHKGDGDCKLDVETGSGSVDVLIGSI